MRLSYRSEENTLRLTLDRENGEVTDTHRLGGYIDIAEQGRLVGIELEGADLDLRWTFATWLEDPVAREYVDLSGGEAYVALSAPGEEIPSHYLRTAEINLTAELDENAHLVAIAIPRRGHGYEISFPSGNQ